jgi:hypothetical protein
MHRPPPAFRTDEQLASSLVAMGYHLDDGEIHGGSFVPSTGELLIALERFASA